MRNLNSNENLFPAGSFSTCLQQLQCCRNMLQQDIRIPQSGSAVLGCFRCHITDGALMCSNLLGFLKSNCYPKWLTSFVLSPYYLDDVIELCVWYLYLWEIEEGRPVLGNNHRCRYQEPQLLDTRFNSFLMVCTLIIESCQLDWNKPVTSLIAGCCYYSLYIHTSIHFWWFAP